MRGNSALAPVFGETDVLGTLFAEILPLQAKAKGPQQFESDTEEDQSDTFVFSAISAIEDDHDHDHGSETVDSQMADIVVPGTASGFAGVVIEGATFGFARPGSDTDGGGGGRGKPPKDDGGTGDDGTGDTGGLLTTYTSGGNARTSYNITINFEEGAWTTELQQVFIDAADYLSTIVLGDISNERVPLFGRVDDLAIDASIIPIDDEGGVLGGAAVFASRVGSDLPAASIMQFDVADIDAALAGGYLDSIVVHEMVHAMGFGGKWADMGLVQTFMEDGVEVLRFTGANATAEYQKLAVAEADAFSFNGVLVESDGGQGTADVHWDDETFTDMLMTGFLNLAEPGEAVLSQMTIAALEDMGYETIYDPGMEALMV